MTAQPDFLYEHGGHLREALIMLEGEDGAYRLLDNAAIKFREGREMLLAAVQSQNTDRRYLLVHYVLADLGRHGEWHGATKAELRRLRHDLRGLSRRGEIMESIIAEVC